VASNPPPPVDVGDQPSNPGGMGDGSPPAGVQGTEPPGGGSESFLKDAVHNMFS
jgi:hypothetical protein